MSGIRKVIGVLIIVFIGIPTLLAMIWGVGVTRAVLSPEVLSDLPREIIEKIPDLLDETLEAVDQEGVVDDDEARGWIRAMADVDTTPKELLEKTGMMNWLQTELSETLEDIGKILRGEMRAKRIIVNLRPLKAALVHPEMEIYIRKVLSKLPACTDSQYQEWMAAAMRGDRSDLPPCLPTDLDKAMALVKQEMAREIRDIPDQWHLFRVTDDSDRSFFFPERGLDALRFVSSFMFLLFLIPAFFIGLASLIGASSGSGILRWMGVSTLVGGGLAFLLSRFTGEIARWGIDFGYYDANIHFPMGEVLYHKTGDLALLVVDTFFTKVNSVAGTVCIVGIVLIALSYLAGSGKKPVQKAAPASPPPQTPQGGGGTGPETPPAPQPQPQKEEEVIHATLEPEEPKPQVSTQEPPQVLDSPPSEPPPSIGSGEPKDGDQK
ncbi:MAG: hypothetical protein GY940_00545 [bacterium]|nr:hypothetical protein [bacterium]